MLKIGILTSGGDCQALNAAMRAVALSLYEAKPNTKIIGFEDGFKGLIYGNYKEMTRNDFEPILNQGGTILGSSREPFKHITKPGIDGINKVHSMIKTYKQFDLDCLVILGGNGSHKTANLLREKGLNIVTLPKTIDNDIYGTDMTFGFYSAVDVAALNLKCIQTTAKSHSRTFIVELMGHKTGWLSLYAGIASGVDVILLPEFPYEIKNIVEKIQKNKKVGKKYTIIALAEGAYSSSLAKLSKKERKEKIQNDSFASASFRLASEIHEELPEEDIRVQVLGHSQRGGDANPYDRIFASQVGAAAATFILNEQYGVMAGLSNNQIVPIPLTEVAGKLKTVPQDNQLIQQGKVLGISFG